MPVQHRPGEAGVAGGVKHVGAHAVPELPAAVGHHPEELGCLDRGCGEPDLGGEASRLLGGGLGGGQVLAVPGDQAACEEERHVILGGRGLDTFQGLRSLGDLAPSQVRAGLPDPKRRASRPRAAAIASA